MLESWLSLTIADKIVSVILVWLSVCVFFIALGLFITKLKLKPKKISKDSVEFADNNVENKDLEEKKEKNLMKHRFFILMDTLKVDGYIMHDVGDCDKKRISIAFLKECMFKTVNEEIKNYIKELEESGGEAIRNMVTLIPKITDLVHEKSKLIKIELTDGIVIQGVPQIYIDKFNGWHYHHNKLLLDNIQSILTDTFIQIGLIRLVLDYLHYMTVCI